MSSPTDVEIASAHAKWRWVRIGLLVAAGEILSLGVLGGAVALHAFERRGCYDLEQDVIDLDVQLSEPGVVRFIATGDTGTGDENQRRVAAAMRSTCARDGCDFILLLGDTFHPYGVASLDDPLFATLFERPFEELTLPFFPTVGNHETYGSVPPLVQYSLRNPKWRMPNYSYDFRAGPAHFFALNTNCDIGGYWGLPQRVRASDAQFTFLFGHHPMYHTDLYNRSHTNPMPWVHWYWESKLQDQVDFYLAGHDHGLKHERFEGSPTDYVTSGAGGKHHDNYVPDQPQPSVVFDHQHLGYAWFEVTPSVARARFYDGDERMIYRFTREVVTRPRRDTR